MAKGFEKSLKSREFQEEATSEGQQRGHQICSPRLTRAVLGTAPRWDCSEARHALRDCTSPLLRNVSF